MKNFFENVYESLYEKAYDAAIEYHGSEDDFREGYHFVLYYPVIKNFKIGYKAKVIYFKEKT